AGPRAPRSAQRRRAALPPSARALDHERARPRPAREHAPAALRSFARPLAGARPSARSAPARPRPDGRRRHDPAARLAQPLRGRAPRRSSRGAHGRARRPGLRRRRLRLDRGRLARRLRSSLDPPDEERMTTFSPGSLVSARGREWIVLTGSDAETLRVRPISGSEDDQTLIHLPLELEPVREARFPPPLPTQRASHDAALLLRDALLLSLRRGAGPFRGFGQIAVEPRAYQLVPLLMALKLEPVRLLIADDVGIGKTIEAGLIARELLDRGDVERTTVLC